MAFHRAFWGEEGGGERERKRATSYAMAELSERWSLTRNVEI